MQKKRRKRQSSFDVFAPYVLKRWREGKHTGLTLWREIKDQGYSGSERTVYRYLETLKQTEMRASTNVHRLHKFSANTAVWLFVRDPKTLDEVEQEVLAAFCQTSPILKRAYHLVQDFLSMVHKREGTRLDAWLTQVAESGLAELLICFPTGVAWTSPICNPPTLKAPHRFPFTLAKRMCSRG
jgi:transposase